MVIRDLKRTFQWRSQCLKGLMKKMMRKRRTSSHLRRTRGRLQTPARQRPQRRKSLRLVYPSARKSSARSPRMVLSRARTKSSSMQRVAPFHLWSTT
jgi:hypothetical protein